MCSNPAEPLQGWEQHLEHPPLAFVGMSRCRSGCWVGTTACCKQTTPGSGKRESAGLALCRDSYIQCFQVLITTAAAAPPRKASWGCTSSFPRARWAAHTEHQSLWLSSGCLEHHWPAKLEQEWGRDLLSSTKAVPLQPWLRDPQLLSEEAMDQHSEQRDNGEMGHKRGQAAATLLCRLHHCLFTPHCPQEHTGLVSTETVQVPGR